jgi:isocitrate/isopropylmalate dehydrogenase
MKRIAVIPGDGIGPEVVREAVRVLKHLQETKGLELKFVDFDWGAEKYLRDGVTLPEGALEMLTVDFDAILAGAFGDPRVASTNTLKTFSSECVAVSISTSICGLSDCFTIA